MHGGSEKKAIIKRIFSVECTAHLHSLMWMDQRDWKNGFLTKSNWLPLFPASVLALLGRLWCFGAGVRSIARED